MIKVRASYARCEILFWDVIFWFMKGLQRVKDSWIAFFRFIQPTVRLHLALLFCACTLGLGIGFVIGTVKVFLSGW